MLKGKSVIELTDVRTNSKEIYEDENLITNAVPDLLRLNPSGLMYPVGEELVTKFHEEIFPIANKCYGGILLFENPLDEDPNKIIPPSDNKIIGYASNDVNSTDASKRGSANLTESSPIENGYKFVWDFSTSQANGRISSLALTHYRGGKYFYGDTHGRDPFLLLNKTKMYSDRAITDIYQGCVEYDIENSTLISIWPKNETSIDIVKLRESITDIGLNDPVYTKGNYLEERTIVDAKEFFEKVYYWKETCFYNGSDEYWYGFGTKYNKLIRMRISKKDYSTTVDEWSLNDISLYKLGDYKDQDSSYCERRAYSCIKDGYLYAIGAGNDDNLLYKININNPVDISKFDLEYDIQRISYSGEYMYLFNWGDYILGHKFSINKNDEIIRRDDKTEYEGRSIPYLMSTPIQLGPLMLGYGGYENSFYKLLFLHTPYLGTINNLSSPILKTADKTMKITYTLTEEE